MEFFQHAEFFECASDDSMSDDEPEDLIEFNDLICGLENRDEDFNITWQIGFLLKIFGTKTTKISLRQARLLTKNVISHFTLHHIINEALLKPTIENTITPFAPLLELVVQFRQFSTYLFSSKYFWKLLKIRLQEIAPSEQHSADAYWKTKMCLFRILQGIIQYIKEEDVDFVLKSPVLKILVNSCHENYPAPRKYLVKYRFSLAKIIVRFTTFVDHSSPDCESTKNLKSRLFSLGIQPETHLLDQGMLPMFSEQYMHLNFARGFLQGKIGFSKIGKCELLVKECALCDNRRRKKLEVCSQCYSIFYCGKKCQRRDWSRHKKVCKSNPFQF